MDTKKRFILSGMIILCVLSMFFTWFGGARDIQEIKGTIVLNNPLTILFVILAFMGIWIKNRKLGGKLTNIGLFGIPLVEFAFFSTWHQATISGNFDLKSSIEYAFPEFYISFAFALVTFVTGFVWLKKEKE